MMLDERRFAPTTPWLLYIFLFAVFALSSWNIRPPQEGYDAPDASELSAVAESGSLARQIGLVSLGVYALLTLRSSDLFGFKINGLTGVACMGYIAWASASVLWSTDVPLTLKAVMRLLVMWFSALIVGRRLTLPQLGKLTLFVSTLTLIVSIVMELRAGTFSPLNTSWRLAGIMHPVSQAWNCGLLSMSAMYLSKRSPSLRKWAFNIGVFAGLLFLALTKSRMALAVTLGCVGIFYWLNSTRRARNVFIISLGACVCGATFLVKSDFKHYAALGREQETESSLGTLTGRIPLWEECIRASSLRPLCGYGYNAFLSPGNLLNVSNASGWMSSPHSGYVGALYELGAIGLTLLVAALLLALRVSIRRTCHDYDQRFVACILVWVVANLLLEAFVITSCFFATFLTFTLLGTLSFSKRSSLTPSIQGQLRSKWTVNE